MTFRTRQKLKQARYELLVPLRSGGISVVWRAIDTHRRQECAIKIMVRGHSEAKSFTRLRNEATITGQLRHPHLIEVLDCFEEEAAQCLVMPLAIGSLEDWIHRKGAVPTAQAVGQFLGILDVLQRIHDLDIVHRDIKPSNILIGNDGHLQLADFGIAHIATANEMLTTTGAVIGSLAYMSPEQRSGRGEPSASSDLYALSLTLAEALVGEPIYDLFAARPSERLRRLIPGDLADILITAAAYEARDRYQSATEMAEALMASHAKQALVPFSTEPLVTVDLSPNPPIMEATVEPVSVSSSTGWRGWPIFLAIGIVAILPILWFTLGANDSAGMVSSSTRSIPAENWDSLPLCEDPLVSMQLDYTVAPVEAMGAIAHDIDGDQKIDLLFTNQAGPSVSIYWGDGNGSLKEVDERPVVRSESRVGIGDLNEDGFNDLVLTAPDEALIALHMGQADRQFSPPVKVFQGSRPSFPLVMDWNGDGHQDVLFTHLDCIAWRQGRGDGRLNTHECLGDAEMVFGSTAMSESERPSIFVAVNHWIEQWTSSPEGWVQSSIRVLPKPQARVHISTTDVDGDGIDELYLFRSFATRSLLRLRAPDWAPCVLAETSPLLFELHTMNAADVNRDGVVDFVGTRTCAGCTSNHLVYRGQRPGR